MLGLCCCMQAFSSCREWEYSPDDLYRLLIAVTSLVVEHRFWGTRASVVAACGLSSCSSRA